MAAKFGKKNNKQNNIFYTIVTAVLLCAIFLAMVSYFYSNAENEAYEYLHVQTRQIKDDITLQLLSGRENLETMANFAAKLYKDGEGYDLMFESFKPIGFIESIGILNPDNTFVTKSGRTNLHGKISFEDEKEKGIYISGRTSDVMRTDYELIRSAVPIVVDGNTVGILYGVIRLDKLDERYDAMAEELDAQLFVYDKATGDLVIDTVHDQLGNISFLKDRKYNHNYTYEQIVSTDKGFSSFLSAYKDENMHLHYSTIEDFDWMICLARYDSQVFATTHTLTNFLLLIFLAMLIIMTLYILLIMASERWTTSVTDCAAEIRKELLETIDGQDNIYDALVLVSKFAEAGAATFFDTNNDEYNFVLPEYAGHALLDDEKNYFKNELIHYASENHKTDEKAVSVFGIKPDNELLKTNPDFYKFLVEHQIKNVSFSATIDKNNYITILCVLNPKNGRATRLLAEKVAACFSMALYNKNILKKTEHAATTDALTGVLNRVAYKSDQKEINEEQPLDFACVYVDVNELHICNNIHGHAAGDEMLKYIANTLKEVFYGHRVYRMGGDEFVVFCKNVKQDDINKKLEFFVDKLKPREYHVSVGMSYRSQNTDCEGMVKEAEKRMYAEKVLYYQRKEQGTETTIKEGYIQKKTGITDIDAMLSVLKESYSGIYHVSLRTDKAERILMPAYLNYDEKEDGFSKLYSKYIAEFVEPEYHRTLTHFLNYETLKSQLEEGTVPKATYKKHDGSSATLSVYRLGEEKEVTETLWVFSKN